jgi:hypothetical protein
MSIGISIIQPNSKQSGRKNLGPEYILHRYDHGVLVINANRRGLPISLLGEASNAAAAAMSGKSSDMFIFPGVAHHYNAYRKTSVAIQMQSAVFAISTNDGGEEWIKEIEDRLASDKFLSPEQKWVCGTDFGASAASIMLGCANPESLGEYKYVLEESSINGAAIPGDASDLGRCIRLLKRFPHIKDKFSDFAMSRGGIWCSVVVDLDALLESDGATLSRWMDVERASQ